MVRCSAEMGRSIVSRESAMLTLVGQPESLKGMVMMLVSLGYRRFPNDSLFSSFFVCSLREETIVLMKRKMLNSSQNENDVGLYFWLLPYRQVEL